jgi:hypothetical protein
MAERLSERRENDREQSDCERYRGVATTGERDR